MDIAKYTDVLLVDKPLTIVNVDGVSAAYNEEKTITGVKNILVYLLTDDYYSTFNTDISWVCENFYKINQNLQLRNKRADEIDTRTAGFAVPKFLTKTLPYRAIRRMRTDGPKGLARSVSNRLKRL